MSPLEGRVAIVTGAGAGLGRSHAFALGAKGARVVVNDVGKSEDGESLAGAVAREIRAAGGEAVASRHDVGDWAHAGELIDMAVGSFGGLDVLVNNAGIVRDRTLAKLSEDEWDAVLRVNLKGHAAPTAHALRYWRERAKAGEAVKASVVHTGSIAGLLGSFGQANYAAAKAAMLGLSRTVSLEAGRYGVRSNVVSPSARTSLMREQEDYDRYAAPPGAVDRLDPTHVSEVITWLARADCAVTDQLLQVHGGRILVFAVEPVADLPAPAGRSWSTEILDEQLTPLLHAPKTTQEFLDQLVVDVTEVQ